MKPLFIALLFTACLAGCVSQKKLVYLQDQQPDVPPAANGLATKTMALNQVAYRIKQEDALAVEVLSLTQEKFRIFDQPRAELVVNKAGELEMPVLGRIKVEGLTLAEAEEKIRLLAVDYLKSPTVHVRMANFTFTVLGEVVNQGTYQTPNAHVTLLEALGRAGGMTDFGDRSNVRLLRNRNGKVQLTYLNTREDNLLLSEYYFLQPDDVLIVSPMKAKTERFTQNNISFVLSLISALAFTYLIIRR